MLRGLVSISNRVNGVGAPFGNGVAGAQQFPILDSVADKVIQKYQQASCEHLWKEKGEPKSDIEQEDRQNAARAIPRCRRSSSTGCRLPSRPRCSNAA